MPDANRSTQIDKDDAPQDAPVAVPPTGKKPGDARDDPQAQQRNREQMNDGVGDDHRTEKMREEKRGTYP
jgi:hypothetical protein